MSSNLIPHDHVLMARDVSSGTIAGATVGAVAAVILMLLCTLPFILKFRRKRRLRRRQEKDALRPEMGTAGLRPPSQTFSTHVNRLSHVSNSRLASAAATLSDHESQNGKEYGPDGITFHRSAAPSPALVGKTLRTCSPAPSIAMAASSASLAEAVMVASRKNSPAVKQSPFAPPADKELGRSPTFGTMTTEPQPISRSGTGSQHGSPSPTIGTFRKLHNKVFHRGSTRSSGSESRATGSRSPDMDLDEFDQAQLGPVGPAPYLVDDKPVMGGAAEEYYSGAPMSPPQEPQYSGRAENSYMSNLIMMPGASTATKGVGRSQQLGSPFNPVAPLSPTSPFVKDEELSSEDGGKGSYEQSRQGKSLSPPPSTRGLLSEQSPKRFEPPPSPSHPAPGTVNPMDMMKPSTAAEQAAWVDTELWKMENSPPPQLENSPAPQLEPSPVPHSLPSPQQQQPAPAPERPQFQAVVRHPTQMDITVGGQAVPHHEEQVITDISDTSSPGPAFDQYAYGPSPSNHTSPDTRLTESAYTGSPSPRSSTSNRPASSNGGTGKQLYHRLDDTGDLVLTDTQDYLGASPGDHSRPSSQGDGSPKPASFACDICGSKFDQVHKLK